MPVRPPSVTNKLSNDEFITTDEFADLIGVRRKLPAEWRGQGRGPRYTKPVHQVRYRMGDVREWLRRQERVVLVPAD